MLRGDLRLVMLYLLCWMVGRALQVTTHVLEHGDEVWCCQFSNGGGMLATSSADGVLLLWNLDGSRERDGRRSPEMHKRITVRHPPQLRMCCNLCQ